MKTWGKKVELKIFISRKVGHGRETVTQVGSHVAPKKGLEPFVPYNVPSQVNRTCG